MAQLMPLPLTVSCCSKIQIGFTFLVPAYPGCPGKEAIKWLLYGCCYLPIKHQTAQKVLPPTIAKSLNRKMADCPELLLAYSCLTSRSKAASLVTPKQVSEITSVVEAGCWRSPMTCCLL